MSIQSIDIQSLQNFINTNDAQLKQIARADAQQEFATSPQRQRESNFATMLPVADSLLQGVAKKGTLSQKGKTVAQTGLNWAIFMSAVALYRKATNKITDTFPALKEFGQEHPFSTTVVDAAVGVTAGMSAIYYSNKAAKFLKKKFSKQFNYVDKAYTQLADDSGIGRMINAGMKQFANKFPKTNNIIKKVSIFALPVICLGILGVYFYDLAKMSSKKDKNYEDLKEIQNKTAEMIAKSQDNDTASI